MGLFDSDLSEQLLLSFNSSNRESLDEIALDQDEQDKVLLNASKSVLPLDLRVDYSQFKNHIFFNSAYTSANTAYSRIIADLPTDGTYREFFEWQRINNGYENWFYDNFPKQQGFVVFQSASAGSVIIDDYEDYLSIGTSSFTIEFIAKHYENIAYNPIFFMSASGQSIIVALSKSASEKFISFEVSSGSLPTTKLSFSVDSYISSSNHYAFLYDQENLYLKTFLNGNLVASGTSQAYGNMSVFPSRLKLGHESTFNNFYSGSIDEFKFWSSNRSSFLSKNFNKTIFANPSGGLKIYYKFNETISYGNRIIDYSGNGLHAQFSGAYSLNSQRVSGTLGSWFKDSGSPILDSANSRVVNFLTEQQNSGSIFDQTNRNYIFNLVPSFFVDDENADQQKLFLLLVARHYDRLKLYIEHLSNIHNINLNSENDTPDRLMNLVASNYGIDLGDVYDSTDPLQYYFGDEVLNASGSLDSSIESIKFRLKRNILNNLIYIVKTKSTRESIKSTLQSLGVDTDVVNINEYSLFSGGIETIRQPKVSECRVLNFNSASIANVHTSSYQISGSNTFQLRVLFNTASVVLTSSIFTIDSGSLVYALRSERENAISTSGTFKLAFRDAGSVIRTISSSLMPVYNNEWVNVTMTRTSGSAGSTGVQGFFVSQLDYDQLINSQSVSTGSAHFSPNTISMYLGTSGSNYFSGNMQEFRAWKNYKITTNLDLVTKWNFDYESLEVNNLNTDIPNLLTHYKLNDFTSSTSNSGTLHDFAAGLTSSYVGFSTSSDENFPGKFIPRYIQSYSYDLNVNNNKIRLRSEGKKLTKSQQTIDIPFVTVDVSPVVSLNKEIIKWFGNLEKFNDIVGAPINRYRDQILELDQYRYNFFEQRVNSKIDFKAYIGLIKWLDSNFTYLLGQLIPLDMISSLSNYVIEPNVLEYNKISYGFPYQISKQATVISASVSLLPRFTASAFQQINPADPGRYGSAVSSSAFLPSSFMSASQLLNGSGGVNFQNEQQRKIQYLSMSTDSHRYRISGTTSTEFYYPSISSSNYLRDVLNINTDYYIYSASFNHVYAARNIQSAPFSTFWTGSLNAAQDQRWMWGCDTTKPFDITWDFGIGYGGGWGQLWEVSGKSRRSNLLSRQIMTCSTSYPGYFDGFVQYDENIDRKIQILWPNIDSFEPVSIGLPSVIVGTTVTGTFSYSNFGSKIDIEGFNSLDFQIAATYATRVAPVGANAKLNFEIFFQFFDEDFTDGSDNSVDGGFEGINSGSNEGSSFKTAFVPHSYKLTSDFYVLDGEGLPLIVPTLNRFSRPLPNSKYMRIKIVPIWTSVYDGWQEETAQVIIKGIFSKKEYKSTDIYEQRSI